MVERVRPVSIRVCDRALEAYKKAASRCGLTLSEWMRVVLDAAAGASPLGAQLARVVYYEDLSKLSDEDLEGVVKRAKKVRDGDW